MRRRQGREDIGAGEQQGIRRRIEAQRAIESILVSVEVGRRWKPQLERQRPDITIGNPPAKGKKCYKIKLEALPWHGLVTAEQLEGHPVSFIVFRYDEACCVAEDADLA